MALFESYERRVDKIMGVLSEYGISSIEECKDITLAAGIDCDKIVRETQPICFENAVWAYTVGAAIALKKGCKSAAEAAAAAEEKVREHEEDPDAHAALFEEKVDKETGKGLSSNDYSDEEKQKVGEAYSAKHSHDNKSLLDSITQAMVNVWNTVTGKYEKPSAGIPKSDLASNVRESLGLADTALQEHQSLSHLQPKTDSGLDIDALTSLTRSMKSMPRPRELQGAAYTTTTASLSRS